MHVTSGSGTKVAHLYGVFDRVARRGHSRREPLLINVQLVDQGHRRAFLLTDDARHAGLNIALRNVIGERQRLVIAGSAGETHRDGATATTGNAVATCLDAIAYNAIRPTDTAIGNTRRRQAYTIHSTAIDTGLIKAGDRQSGAAIVAQGDDKSTRITTGHPSRAGGFRHLQR